MNNEELKEEIIENNEEIEEVILDEDGNVFNIETSEEFNNGLEEGEEIEQ